MLSRAEAVLPRAVADLVSSLEYAGLAENFELPAEISGIPPGAVLSVEFEIPDDERWLWLLMVSGGFPSSSLVEKFEWVGLDNRERKAVLPYHEGWVGNVVCPSGAKPMKEGTYFRLTLGNVTDYTGDPDLDAWVPYAQAKLGPTTVNFESTCFMVRIFRGAFEIIDNIVRSLGLVLRR